ncbi:MAG TPA: hypothetical protein VFR49_15125 [Solirubrobacteraceae bacterium]|nr:hypothetical protein [Solirubrobacteraceae bacterium]
MNRFLTLRGRLAATILVTGALVVGGAAAGTTAYAQTPGGGLFASGTTSQTTSGLGAGLFGGQGKSMLPGAGLFKAVFAIFGAVRTEVPVIAGPIIAQGVTDKTITQAEAAQLTAWLSGQDATTSGAPTKPSAGEISVLRKVIAAVLGQLPTIAAPVLVQEVANGDLTQGEADMIAKILGGLAGKLAGATSGVPAPTTTTGLSGTAASGGLLAALESKVAAQVKKTTRHRKHKKTTTQTTRTHRSR